jgi:hypothetical protein
MTETRQHHDILVGIDSENCVVILEDSFKYADGFHGTTGKFLRPVYTAEYDYELSVEGLAEYYRDTWVFDVESRSTDLGLSEWVDLLYFELVQERFDFVCLNADNLAELESVVPNAKDVIGYETIGVGRIFPDALKDIKKRLSGYAQACELVDRFETTV